MSAGVNPVDWKLMAGYIPVWANEVSYTTVTLLLH
jgi:hypothetical protein